MEKPIKIGQIYGYTICVVSVITFLIALPQIIASSLDMREPLRSGYLDPKLLSFEAYKLDTIKGIRECTGSAATVSDDKTLRAMFESALSHKTQGALFQARKSMMIGVFLAAISVALFVTHWVWLKKLGRESSNQQAGLAA